MTSRPNADLTPHKPDDHPPPSISMEKLNQILNAHVADGQDTKDKLLGAGFMVLKGDGEILYLELHRCQFHPLPNTDSLPQKSSIKVPQDALACPRTRRHGASTL